MGSTELGIISDLVGVFSDFFGNLESGASGIAYFLGEDFGDAVAAGFMK